MSTTQVKFRCGTPVTANSPELVPGSFVFDTQNLVLYIDMVSGRLQVRDPLKLSLTGGSVTGDIEVLDGNGRTVSSLGTSGVVSGTYLESTGEIHLNTAPQDYAVMVNGRIYTRSAAETIADLGIDQKANSADLGALAYLSSAQGSYTPQGSISAPTIDYTAQSVQVVDSITAGDLPQLEMDVVEEGTVRFSFSQGTATTATKTSVLSGITGITASTPVFTGQQATITVQPAGNNE